MVEMKCVESFIFVCAKEVNVHFQILFWYILKKFLFSVTFPARYVDNRLV